MGLVILNEETDARMGFHSDFTGACILPLRPGCFVVGEGVVCSREGCSGGVLALSSPNLQTQVRVLTLSWVLLCGCDTAGSQPGSSFPDCSDEKARECGAAFFEVSNCLE